MQRPLSLALVVSALAATVGCAPPAAAPATDSCTAPSGGSIDTLELGVATTSDLAGHMSTFVPLADGDSVTLLQGGQGAFMLGFILRVSGASAPTCLGQQTTVTDTAGNRVTAASPPLTTYPVADGTRVTHPEWMPADYPSSILVSVDAAGRSLALHLHVATP